MADSGFSYDTLVASLSALGTSSGALISLSVTGKDSGVMPLVDYGDFSQYIFFGNAVRRFNTSLDRIVGEYPIGASGTDTASLCAENIFKVDEFKKKSTGFDLWLLNKLGITGSSSANINATPNVTVNATNQDGDLVPLIFIDRGLTNSLTGSQTGVSTSISARAVNFEEENRNVVDRTAGTAEYLTINTSLDGLRRSTVRNALIELPSTAETTITRGPELKTMLPNILFMGDEDEILEKMLAALGDELDEIKTFIDQMSNVKRISYDNYNRVPNKFLPVLAEEFGIKLFGMATNSNFQNYLTESTSGSTSQEITYDIWNKILNNIQFLLKAKGTKSAAEAISRIYGVDHNFVNYNEYSAFHKPDAIRITEEVDVPVFYTSGDAFIQTTSDATTGSALAFDFPASTNFTVQMRVSATGDHASMTLLKHPLYTIDMDASGRVAFKSTITSSMSAITDLTSMSGWIKGGGSADNFVNIAVSRSGDTLRVWAMALSGSPTGGHDIVSYASGSTAGYDIANMNFSSTGGVGTNSVGGTNYSQFPTYFPASGSFTGYMHEVRTWHNVALQDEDLFEQTRNFESVSFQNSTGSVNTVGITNKANFSSLSAHYKLRENVVLTGSAASYNFIVDSTTASNTAHPVSFGGLTGKHYRVFDNQKKLSRFSPVGLAADNDKITQGSNTNRIIDTGYVSYSLSPINVLNNAIRNFYQNLDIAGTMGDPEDLFRKQYTGPFVEQWHDITAQMGLAPSATFATQSSTSWDRIRSGGQQNGLDAGSAGSISGASGNTTSVTDLNAFVKALSNFNDTFGGIFTFIKQFIPAKSATLAEGVFIENHLLERPKMKRTFGLRESTGTGYVGAPTMSGDRGVIAYDEGKEPYNQVPSLIDIAVTSFTVNNHYNPGNLSTQGSNSANDATLIASAATTADFQGYQYQDGVQEFLDNSVTAVRNVPALSVNSSTNVPRFLPTRIGRALPLTIKPANPADTEIELTVDKLLLSPTASPISANIYAVIKGRTRMLAKGNAFKTEMPAMRFDFPASGNGDNFFEATIGNIAAGKGRTIKDKDVTFTTSLETGDIEFELRLSDGVRALTGEERVSQSIVDRTVSGSVGIVPLRITNLFNNSTTVFRVGINSDSTRDTDIIREISDQGGVKIQS
jgi:hypothetical protein